MASDGCSPRRGDHLAGLLRVGQRLVRLRRAATRRSGCGCSRRPSASSACSGRARQLRFEDPVQEGDDLFLSTASSLRPFSRVSLVGWFMTRFWSGRERQDGAHGSRAETAARSREERSARARVRGRAVNGDSFRQCTSPFFSRNSAIAAAAALFGSERQITPAALVESDSHSHSQSCPRVESESHSHSQPRHPRHGRAPSSPRRSGSAA